jgi:co-chaperonin GroES (HSP10)
MDFKAYGDKLLVLPINSESNSGGLFIPDTATNLKKGTVISAGEGKDKPIPFKEGDIVYYKRENTSEPITIDGEHYIILLEREVWGETKK